MFSVRREQGRLAELAPVIRILAGRGRPRRPVAPRARRAARRARHGGGGAGASWRASPPTGSIPFRESLWLASLTYLTDACAALGDEAMAALVYPELEPLAGTNVMIGHLVACYGAADRYLGMLAATLGESDRAEAHFERAHGAQPGDGRGDLARAHRVRVRALPARARRADRERADALLGEAASLAERIGMPTLLAQDPGARPRAAPAAGLPDGLSPREAQILALVARGLSNREIGDTLTISEHTAANHIRSILRKTRLRQPHRGRVLCAPPAPARVGLTRLARIRPCRST